MEGPRVLWWAEFSSHVAASLGISCILYASAYSSFSSTRSWQVKKSKGLESFAALSYSFCPFCSGIAACKAARCGEEQSSLGSPFLLWPLSMCRWAMRLFLALASGTYSLLIRYEMDPSEVQRLLKEISAAGPAQAEDVLYIGTKQFLFSWLVLLFNYICLLCPKQSRSSFQKETIYRLHL